MDDLGGPLFQETSICLLGHTLLLVPSLPCALAAQTGYIFLHCACPPSMWRAMQCLYMFVPNFGFASQGADSEIRSAYRPCALSILIHSSRCVALLKPPPGSQGSEPVIASARQNSSLDGHWQEYQLGTRQRVLAGLDWGMAEGKDLKEVVHGAMTLKQSEPLQGL